MPSGISDHQAPPAICITEEAIRTIAVEAQRSQDGLETGGILLGVDDAEAVTIHRAGGPGPHAKRAPARFDRDTKHAQQLASAAWIEYRWQWIGEWHTHPSGELKPSALDMSSYARHLHDPDLNFRCFVSLIVRTQSADRIAVAAWLITQDHADLVPVMITAG
jgi:integrative and conjugative element protein (TIGR02256 family)